MVSALKMILSAFLTISIMGVSSAALADDDIPASELPRAVTDAIESQFPGAKLIEAERDTDNGNTYYEVEICHDGTEYDLEISPDGKITDTDRDGNC